MIVRPRRRRQTEGLRGLVREHHLRGDQLIAPVFVRHGADVAREIGSMPGVFQLSVDDRLDTEIDQLLAVGVRAVILFGIPAVKDETGTENFAADGIVQRALRRIRARAPSLTLITDVCCCEFTSHGHCGVLRGQAVDNDATLEVLGRVAESHVEAGAHVVAPSGMMDGAVGAIRTALDRRGFLDTAILGYSVKFASAFYGPFREAAESTPAFGDRRQYQMDPANHRESIQEIRLDEAEGADLVMVKPALAYLDIIQTVRATTTLPVVAYSVSGEYAMIAAAGRAGWIDERKVALESLLAIRRAGADAIITYYAKAAARWLREEAA